LSAGAVQIACSRYHLLTKPTVGGMPVSESRKTASAALATGDF